MAFKLRSSNPISTPLSWPEMDDNLSFLLLNLSGSNIKITGSSGVGIKGNTTISGTLDINSTLTLTSTASVNHVNPSLDITYDLGRSNLRYNNIYSKNIIATTITASLISGSILLATSASYASSSTYSLSSSYASSSTLATTASSILGGATSYIPFWSSSTALSSSIIQVLTQVSANDNIRISGSLRIGPSNTNGVFSLAHGSNVNALGLISHAEGALTYAYGTGSHAEGFGTIATASYQHVTGKYNSLNSQDLLGQNIFIVGNGTGIGTESNAFKVTMSGSIIVATGSGTPSWVGQEGEIKPNKSGSLYFLYCYIGGQWRSSSLF